MHAVIYHPDHKDRLSTCSPPPEELKPGYKMLTFEQPVSIHKMRVNDAEDGLEPNITPKDAFHEFMDDRSIRRFLKAVATDSVTDEQRQKLRRILRDYAEEFREA